MSKIAILCVDDEVVILDSLKRQLKRHFGPQYIYEVAENAGDAWEVITELNNDGVTVLVVVSDWLMPGVKGDEFLIQVHQQFPNVIKILLTGQADETAIRRVKEQANLHRYLDKPWQEDDLINAITTGLENL